MAMTVKPTSAPKELTNFEGLDKGLRSLERDSEDPMIICNANHERPKKPTALYDQRTLNGQGHWEAIFKYTGRDKAYTLYSLLQKAAQGGQTSETIELKFCSSHERIQTHIIFEFFRKKMELTIAPPSGKKGHTHFCFENKSPIEVQIFWASNNRYLDPKPPVQLHEEPSWGPALLNEERNEGKGDCTLIFGGKRFTAHRLIVGSFSPFMRQRLENTSNSKELNFPEITNFSQEALETFITLMYMGRIDLNKFPVTTALQLLELSPLLKSNVLRKIAFDHLYEIGYQLKDRDILQLCFFQSEHPFEELEQLCTWLLRVQPKFYENLVFAEEIQEKDYIQLTAVASYFKLEDLEKQIL
jgi:hypothetical protein